MVEIHKSNPVDKQCSHLRDILSFLRPANYVDQEHSVQGLTCSVLGVPARRCKLKLKHVKDALLPRQPMPNRYSNKTHRYSIIKKEGSEYKPTPPPPKDPTNETNTARLSPLEMEIYTSTRAETIAALLHRYPSPTPEPQPHAPNSPGVGSGSWVAHASWHSTTRAGNFTRTNSADPQRFRSQEWRLSKSTRQTLGCPCGCWAGEAAHELLRVAPQALWP